MNASYTTELSAILAKPNPPFAGYIYVVTMEDVYGTCDSDRIESNMVPLLYISEPKGFKRCLVSLF